MKKTLVPLVVALAAVGGFVAVLMNRNPEAGRPPETSTARPEAAAKAAPAAPLDAPAPAAPAGPEPDPAEGPERTEDEPAPGFRGAIVGHVTDPSGEPIPGAAVEWARRAAPDAIESRSLTDADGAYRLEVAAAGPSYRLAAWIAGRAPAWTFGVVPGTAEAPAVADFELAPGATLSGVVRDPDGAPVEGADVVAGTPPSGFNSSFSVARGSEDFPGDGYRTRTDEGGAFEIRDLPGEQVQLLVTKDGFGGHHAVHDVPAELEIVLPRRDGTLRARVVDAQTGEPVREFEVRSYERRWPFSTADGRFEISTFHPDVRYRVEVVAPGYALEPVLFDAAPASSAAEREVRLERGVPFRAILVDAATGRPLEGIEVVAGVLGPNAVFGWDGLATDYTGMGPLSRVERLRTDGSGRIELRETRERATLFIAHPGFERKIVRPEDRPAPDDRELSILPLAREASISARWTGPSSARPIRATLWREPGPGEPDATLEDAPVDASGRFRLGSLVPGAYHVTVELEPVPGRLEALTRRVEVGTGEDVEVALGGDLGPHEVRGKAAPSASLRFSPESEWGYTGLRVRADPRGDFRLSGLRPGRYRVDIAAESHGGDSVHLLHTRKEVEVTDDGEIDLTGG